MNVCNILYFVPLYVEDKKGAKKKLRVVQNVKEVFNELPTEERIHSMLNESKGVSVNEICKRAGIKKRTARKCLSRLESKGLVKRKVGTSINKNFRFGDKWYFVKKFQIDLKNKSFIKYESTHRNNKKIHYLLLPRYIKIDEKFVRSVGLLDAEKTKFTVKRGAIEFVNSEPLMINEILDFLEIFYIRKEYWKWRIIFNGNIRHLIKNNIEGITNFWIDNTGLSGDMQHDFSPYFTKPKGSYKIKTMLGSLIIDYNNLLFHNFIENLSKKVRLYIMNNEDLIWFYLSGFLCGEAYVGDRKCKEIQIGFQNSDQLEYVKELLKQVGVNTSYSRASSTSPPRILICSKDNFLKLYEKGIFDINLKKKASLIRRLLGYKKIDDKTKYILSRDLEKLDIRLKERELI